MNKFLYLILIVAFLGMPLCAQGQENTPADIGSAGIQAVQEEDTDEAPQGDETTPVEEVESPQKYIMAPDINTWLGARAVAVDGAKRSIQYGWPFSSVAGGFKLHYSPLPHRLDAELDWLNLYDNQAEFGYAYKDIVKLNYMGMALWHNLPHYSPTTSPAALSGVVDFNPAAGYHVDTRDDRIAMRLKWPDRPFHIFSEFRQFEKEGTIQQRFYALFDNSGATPISGKFAKSRDIDWITRNYVIGINGHLGPLEAEYSHRTKTFDPHGVLELNSDYNFRVFRLPDVYSDVFTSAHNKLPHLENQYDTLRVHTNLTGSIVGAVTLTTGRKENEGNGAHADFNRVFGDLTIKPMDKMTIAVRYRYNNIQVDNPSLVNDPGFANGLIPSQRPTFDSIDRMTNRADIIMRYMPSPAVALKLEYDFLNVIRSNTKEWSENLIFQTLPEDQNIHTVKAGVDLRPFKTLNLRASTSYVYTSDPAYPTMPQNQFNGKLDANWTPISSVTTTAYYRLTRESNNTSNMRGYKDNAGTLVTWSPIDRLSVYGNYDFARYHKINEAELSMVLSAGPPAVSGTVMDNVPYTDTSHVYSLGVGYKFSFPLTLNSEFHQSWSKGKFRTDAASSVTDSSYIGPLTDLNVRETGGSVKASYDFNKGWGTSVNYAINDYQILNKPQDGPQDGTAHTVMLIVSKKW